MKVLCLDTNGSDSVARTKALEDAGFVVLQATDDARAQDLVGREQVDVVCVHSRSIIGAKPNRVSKVKALLPHVPFILIHDSGPVPDRFEEFVDEVVYESDFRGAAESLIRNLRDAQCPFFVRWFEGWQYRCFESEKDSRVPA